MDIGVLGVYICLFLGLYFEVFLLISFLEHKAPEKTATRPRYYPTVAILVPCWNKEKTLAATVRSLLALTYPKKKLSIVIIDDGSTDGTLTAAQQFKNYPQIKIFSKKNEGSKYSALNFGLAHTESELVGCLDADSFVETDALIEMVKAFETDPSIMAVTPAMLVHRPRNLLELMQAVEYTIGVFFKKAFDYLGAIWVIPGPFSIYRREVFVRVGDFRRAHHTEDMEMAFRMHEHKLKIVNAHTALVHTTVPRSIGALIRQRTRWSQGFLGNSWDYSHLFFNPRFGNLGLFALPAGLFVFVAGIYGGLYLLYTLLSSLVRTALDLYTTRVPVGLSLSFPSLDWFFLPLNTLTFLSLSVIVITLVVIYYGKRMGGGVKLGTVALVSYFMMFSLLGPVWLMRAVWDTALARDTGWLT